MPEVKHVSAKNGDVIVMVGTMKGAFVLRQIAQKVGRRRSLLDRRTGICHGF
jgi:hypothetical protein